MRCTPPRENGLGRVLGAVRVDVPDVFADGGRGRFGMELFGVRPRGGVVPVRVVGARGVDVGRGGGVPRATGGFGLARGGDPVVGGRARVPLGLDVCGIVRKRWVTGRVAPGLVARPDEVARFGVVARGGESRCVDVRVGCGVDGVALARPLAGLVRRTFVRGGVGLAGLVSRTFVRGAGRPS